MRDQQGKPGALLAVHYSNQTSMWMPMLRGFLDDLLMAWRLFALLDAMLKGSSPFQGWTMNILCSLTKGLIGYFAINYTHFIWHPSFDILASLQDKVLPWAIPGEWHGVLETCKA
jgi:hypothetical protein